MVTLKIPGTKSLEVKIESILLPNIVEPFAGQILRECGTGSSWENKDKWGVMWLQQVEFISQEEGDITNKT